MITVRKVCVGIDNLPEKYNGFRILFIGDVHAGSPFFGEKRLEEIVKTAKEQKADVVLNAGDYLIQGVVGGKFVSPEIVASKIGELNAPYGHYSVLGNHDWWHDGDLMRQELEKNGVKVLENNSLNIAKQGDEPLWVIGLADMETRSVYIKQALKGIDRNDLTILLTHQPDIFPEIPDWIDLTLAGHTHGGQIRLPFIGVIFVPSEYGNRYARGLIEENGKKMFVTQGLGTSILPIRFLCPPEIVVIELKVLSSTEDKTKNI